MKDQKVTCTSPFQVVALLTLCLTLAGCISPFGVYYPFSYQTTQCKFSDSPFRDTEAQVDSGNLHIHISDPSIKESAFETEALRRATFVQANVITDSGKVIALKLWITSLGDGITYSFRLKDAGFDDNHFSLRVTVNLTGKPVTFTGECSVHGHTKIVNLDDISG